MGKGLTGSVLVAAAAVAAYFGWTEFGRKDDADGPGQAAIIAQPSGEVVTVDGAAGSTAQQTSEAAGVGSQSSGQVQSGQSGQVTGGGTAGSSGSGADTSAGQGASGTAAGSPQQAGATGGTAVVANENGSSAASSSSGAIGGGSESGQAGQAEPERSAAEEAGDQEPATSLATAAQGQTSSGTDGVSEQTSDQGSAGQTVTAANGSDGAATDATPNAGTGSGQGSGQQASNGDARAPAADETADTAPQIVTAPQAPATPAQPDEAVELAAIDPDKPVDPGTELTADRAAPASQGDGSAPSAAAPTPAVSEKPDGAPRFDVVRVDQDGQTVIAGSAAPNEKVEVLIDGEVVGEAQADQNGAFVAVIFAALSDQAQRLELRVPVAPDATPAPTEPEPASTPADAQDEAAQTGQQSESPGGEGAGGTGNATQEGQSDQAEASSEASQLTNTDSSAAAQTGADQQAEPNQTAASPSTESGAGAPVQSSDQNAELSQSATSAPAVSRTGDAEQGSAGETADLSQADPAAVTGQGSTETASDAATSTSGVAAVTQDTQEDQPAVATSPQDLQPAQPAQTPVLSDQAPTVSAQIGGLAGPSTGDQTSNVQAGAGGGSLDRTSSVSGLGSVSGPASLPSTGAGAGNGDGARYALSAPVIILPSTRADAAPTLVQPKREGLAVLQPGGGPAKGVVLDRINYGQTGSVDLAGRGTPGRAVRVYGNGQVMGTTRVAQDGTWDWSIEEARGRSIKLFRFDELDSIGTVTSRIETPFTYSALSPQVVRERRVVIQKGDYLWRIAEQFYGQGIRYSEIYGANSELIRDPDLIYPGQVFSIPELVDAE